MRRPLRLSYRLLRAWIVIGSVAVVSFVAYSLPSFFGKQVLPSVHDEFAYLLQADTFAHGRITNPPSPMWQHFETFHVIQQPTYTAKFPPGQGLALALGQRLGGPIIGVRLSVALALAAVTWMLLAWVRPGWALVGTLMIAATPTTLEWSQSYWGGAVAMMGGALLVGAAARMARRPGVAMGALAGLGAGILANSRPFEGMIVCVLVAILTVGSSARRHKLGRLMSRSLPAALAVLLPIGAAMGYYNYRVTGSPWQFPYTLYQKQYMIAPLLFFESPASSPPVYRHEIMRKFFVEDESEQYLSQKTVSGFLATLKTKLELIRQNILWPWTVLIPLAAALWMIRSSRAARWGALVCIGLPLVELFATPWFRLQYLAPAMGCLAVLMVIGLRRIDLARWKGWRVGRAAVVILILCQLTGAAVWAKDWSSEDNFFARYRAQVVSQLKQLGGKHLLIVRYSPAHLTVAEMVYNPADINSADVIFARDMGDEQNQELVSYFHDRTAWLFKADELMLYRIQPNGQMLDRTGPP